MSEEGSNIARLGFAIDPAPFEALKTSANAAREALRQFAAAAGSAEDAAKKQASATQAAATAQVKQETATDKVGKGSRQAALGAKELASAADQLKSKAESLQQVFSGLTMTMMGGGGIGSGLMMVAGGFRQIVASLGPVGLALGAATVAVGFLGKGYTDLMMAVARANDMFVAYEQRLKLSLGTTYAARDAIKSLIDMSNVTGVSLESTISAFTRFARNIDDLGATRSELLQLTNTIQKLGILSGAAPHEISGSMIQLSQALAAGRLNGDELRSVMENMPAIIKSIADGLGRSAGEIRAMGAAGELTSNKILAAILSQSEKINAEFEEMPNTTERAAQRLSNLWSTIKQDVAVAFDASTVVQGWYGHIEEFLKWFHGRVGQKTPEQAQAAAQTRLMALENQYNTALARGFDVGSPAVTRLKKMMELAQNDLDSAMGDILKNSGDKAVEAVRAMVAEAKKPVTQGVTAARQIDERSAKINKLTEDLKKLDDARNAIEENRWLSPDADRDLKSIEAAAIRLRQQYVDAAGAVATFATKVSELMADTNAFKGGAIDAMAQAREIAKAARGEGIGASAEGVLSLVLQERVAKTMQATQDARQQAANQNAIAKAYDTGVEAVKRAQTAIQVLDYQYKTFGNITTPATTAAVSKYAAALAALTKAQDTVAMSQRRMEIADSMRLIGAGTGAVGGGPFAIREAEAMERARQAERTMNGIAGPMMEEFRRREEQAAAKRGEELRIEIDGLRERNKLIADPAAARRLEIELEIAKARREFGGGAAGMVEQIKTKAALELENTYRSQTMEIVRQRQEQEQGLTLATKIGEEYRVQKALLEARFKLTRDGVSAESDYAKAYLRMVEASERWRANNERAIAALEQTRVAFDNFLPTVAEGVGSALTRGVQTGQFAFRNLFDGLKSAIREVEAAMIRALVTEPLKRLLQAQFGDILKGQLGIAQGMSPGGFGALGGGGSYGLGASDYLYTVGAEGGYGTAIALHTGGIVGLHGAPRSVPMGLFAGAKRYHRGGIAGDEVPAILKRGEIVMTPQQAAGGRTVKVEVNNTYHVDSRSDASSIGMMLEASRQATLRDVAESVSRDLAPMRR